MRQVKVTETAIIKEALVLSDRPPAMLERMANARGSRGDYSQVTRKAARRVLNTRRTRSVPLPETLRRLERELLRIEEQGRPIADELEHLSEGNDYAEDLRHMQSCVEDGNFELAREAMDELCAAIDSPFAAVVD